MGQIINDIEAVLKNKQQKKEAENERRKILAEIRRVNADKANIGKKALAAQRARFGAGAGGGSAGLSQDAVMKRLLRETEEPYDEKLRAAGDRLSKIKTPRTNLLKILAGRLL